MLIAYVKAHPAESIAIVLALFNIIGKLAGEVQSPGAKKALGFVAALGPDLVGALQALTKSEEKKP